MDASNLDRFIGRSLVFVESGHCCLARVIAAAQDENWFTAEFERHDSPAVACEYPRFVMPGETREVDWESEPFSSGQRWTVQVSPREFFIEDDVWQATFMWGGGFRIFFKPQYVEEFSSGSLEWLWRHYADEEGQDDESDQPEDD